MIVMKFGGSSVASASRIQAAAKIVQTRLPRRPVLVLSAMGDVTDHLLEAGKRALTEGPASVEALVLFFTGLHGDTIAELGISGRELDEIETLLEELAQLIAGISLIRELSPKTRDYLVSFGERLSVRIAAAYLNKTGIRAQALDAWDAGITSSGVFTNAEPLDECWQNIPRAVLPLTEAGIVPVITGFIAKCYAETDDRTHPTAGDITTLGRGGSDLTATLIGAACRAEEVQVWKDVDGVLTADPRVVPEARPVEHITYDEAAELAYFGAQVLHPRAMQPCMKTGVPVLVKNSYAPEARGTRISGERPRGGQSEAPPVRAVTSRGGITLIDIVSTRMLGQSGFLAEVFAIFAAHRVSIDVIATSEVSVSLTIDGEQRTDALKRDLERVAGVEVHTGKAIVAVICDVDRSAGILARVFTACAELGLRVEMVSHGASKVNVSFIVAEADAVPAVQAIHHAFFPAAGF